MNDSCQSDQWKLNETQTSIYSISCIAWTDSTWSKLLTHRTTTDVGMLVSGLPRPAPHTIEVAGVRTNFQVPDIFSVGLGGGSHVIWSPDGTCAVGPISLGHQLGARYI